MRNKKGITIIELLVVLVLSGIMLIGVNALSNIGNTSHRKLTNEASIYNDLSYAFKLIQSRIHQSKIQSNGTELIAGSQKFDVYTHAGGRDLVYYPNRFNEYINSVIFSVSSNFMNFVHNINADSGEAEVTVIGKEITPKYEVPFNMSITVQSRRY